MEVVIRHTAAEVAEVAADILAGYIRPGGVLGVATGSTPIATYHELIARHGRGELSAEGVEFFALDEYVGLDHDHPQSYYRTLRDELIDPLEVAPEHLHVPDGMADPHTAGAAYEEQILAAGGIDCQLLGVGVNGHIGFNEPTSSLNSVTRLKILHPQTVKDNARFFDSAEEVPRRVLTQGLGTIQRAGRLLLIAIGTNKADAVAKLVEGPLSAACPASILQWHPHATVVVDEEAAAGLVNREYYEFAEANKPE
ncbi:glucosamine-6-phosphate deaminase [Corynebacterium frankenforstense]|uniref:glucosamine-6-phosphate deaminase n=1 Tax=Corynebacterium TaxID=1716 RepID=UPI00254F7E9E|nr:MULTISPECIES: glucosamine-6-phosphate deaminase [Corynebacterium]MDK6260022.1 glucosamine-6-phosphate deaminase [Corynebacterium frankenforstense]MDK8895180.1 glucosamine-6-phosphate deaminase [Corynebacterium sp. MSK006]